MTNRIKHYEDKEENQTERIMSFKHGSRKRAWDKKFLIEPDNAPTESKIVCVTDSVDSSIPEKPVEVKRTIRLQSFGKWVRFSAC